jgi:hypothetical protein
MPALFRRPLLIRLLRSLALLVLAWLALSWLLVLVLRFVPPWTSAVMLERQLAAWIHGEQDFQLRQHWVPWNQVSPWVPLAMVAGEDQKFPYHHGFDFDSIHNAIDAADDGGRLRGASTISQQTAKNLVPVEWPQLRAQRVGSVFHRADRADLAEAAHPRGVHEHRRAGQWHLWRGRGQRHVLPHRAGATQRGASRTTCGGAAQPTSPACGSPECLCAASRRLDPSSRWISLVDQPISKATRQHTAGTLKRNGPLARAAVQLVSMNHLFRWPRPCRNSPSSFPPITNQPC